MSRNNNHILEGRVSQAPKFTMHKDGKTGTMRVQIAVTDAKGNNPSFFRIQQFMKNFETQQKYLSEQLQVGTLVSCLAEFRSGEKYVDDKGKTIYPTYFEATEIGSLESKSKRESRKQLKSQQA